MKRYVTAFLLIFLIQHMPVGYANVTISVVKPPASIGDNFFAQIVGGDIHDLTPNPCYNVPGCHLRFFTISPLWMPSGMSGYTTADQGTWDHGNNINDTSSRTLGQWWLTVRNRARTGYDFLPTQYGEEACVVLAAYNNGMVSGSIVSNCALGIVQAAGCVLKPDHLEVGIRVQGGNESAPVHVPGVFAQCDSPATVRIETNTNEEIPLGADNSAVAVLDWGSGYGRPATISIRGNESRPIPLSVKTRGVSTLGAGVYSGSAIINVSYD